MQTTTADCFAPLLSAGIPVGFGRNNINKIQLVLSCMLFLKEDGFLSDECGLNG